MDKASCVLLVFCLLFSYAVTENPESGAGAGILHKMLRVFEQDENREPATTEDKLRLALRRAPPFDSKLHKLVFSPDKERGLSGTLRKADDVAGNIRNVLRGFRKHERLLDCDDVDPNSDSCTKDYGSYTQSLCKVFDLTEFDYEIPEWAFSLFDAMGKIPHGIMEGKLHWPGAFFYCEDMRLNYTFEGSGDPELRNITGQYCRIELGLKGENETLLSIGVCTPNSCSPQNVTNFLRTDKFVQFFASIFDLEVHNSFCGHRGNLLDDPVTHPSIIYTILIVVLVVVASLLDAARRIVNPETAKQSISATLPGAPAQEDEKSASGYANGPTTLGGVGTGTTPGGGVIHFVEVNPEEYRRYSITTGNVYEELDFNPKAATASKTTGEQDRPGLLMRIILSFSAIRALEFLGDTNLPYDDIGCLRGIRVLSLAWLMIGHTFLLGIFVAVTWTTSNLVTASDALFKDWGFQAVLQFDYAADSFLVVTGVLSSFLFLKHVDRNYGKVTPLYLCYSIVHRYWRLIVPYMLFIGFFAGFYKYVSSGPFVPEEVSDGVNCRNNWWVNLLLQVDLVRNDAPCLTYTWYISTIFKFHIVGLIIMFCYVKKAAVGAFLMLGCIAGHLVANFVLTNRIIDRDDNEVADYYTNILIAPWCRVAPFIEGMIVGIVIFKKRELKINMVVNFLMWLVALTVVFALVYSPFDQFREGGVMWTKPRLVAYDSLSRVAFGFSISWMVLSCATGNGGIVNRILAWKAWIPLDKLCYTLFIIHGVLMFGYTYSRQSLIEIYEGGVTYLFIGHYGYISMLTVIMSLIYTLPFMFLENAVIPPAIRYGSRTAASEAQGNSEMFQNEQELKQIDHGKEFTPGNFKKVDITAM